MTRIDADSSRLALAVPSQAQMFEAIGRRDTASDGLFVYGVVTTGVFCRPSCASRPARRENVRFFGDVQAAAAGGFRPCKRCRPERVEKEMDALARIARYIESHADERLTLKDLAAQSELSPGRFQKRFKAAFGVSPKQFQEAARLGRLKEALRDGDSVTGAIFEAGYGSVSRVYGAAARHLGMSPRTYRAGGAGETIYHAYRESALGQLMLAATPHGVCFAQFGESRAELLERLSAEFPRAELKASPAAGAPALDAWISALDEHLGGEAPRPDLPLDLRGTAFQLRVWRFLLSVKEGDVLSYGELAAGIGKPKAARAVASACGSNRIGVLVPCHRVLRGDGDIGGYRWGVARKRTLLDVERRRRADVQS